MERDWSNRETFSKAADITIYLTLLNYIFLFYDSRTAAASRSETKPKWNKLSRKQNWLTNSDRTSLYETVTSKTYQWEEFRDQKISQRGGKKL